MLAEVTTLVAELNVNIYDLEIAHSAEGERGVLVLTITAEAVDVVRAALRGPRLSPSRLVRSEPWRAIPRNPPLSGRSELNPD